MGRDAALVYAVGIPSPLKTPKLSLRELEALASTLLAVLLAFLGSRVASQKTSALESLAQFGVEFAKRSSDPVTNGTRLPSGTPTLDIDENVELTEGIGQL